MDEQTTQEQTQESSFEPDFEQTEPINDIPEDEPVSEPDGDTEPEISIQDGEVKFSDDFFDDVPEKENYNEDEELKPKSLQQKTEPEQETPNYYTDEEIQNTPAEQWDKARMPEDVRRYYEAFQNQQAAYARQQEIQQRAQTPPPFLTQPKVYTPKELHEEAMKNAIQILGLKSADDFDIYEGEHATALAMARQELLMKNAFETYNYQHKASEYKNWQMFSGELAGQPDFNEFHQWFINEVRNNGNTPEQINAGLKNLAEKQGFGVLQQVWGEFYRQFKERKAQAQNQRAIQSMQRTRAKVPPQLESTQGGNASNRKNYNMRDFGNLDEDAQVQALMDMGIV